MRYYASKGELSTEPSRQVVSTARNFERLAESVRANKKHEMYVRKSMSPKKVDGVQGTIRKIDNSIFNDIADETVINKGNGFMDGYYASNGYFSFSLTKEEMWAKDSLFEKLQTFVDERLLEIAGQIGLKQQAESTKEKNLDKLGNLKLDLDKLISENESLQNLKISEYNKNRNLTRETENLQQLIKEIKGKQEENKLSHFLEMEDLNKALDNQNEFYFETEQDYTNSKKVIRIELHEDKALITKLENSLIEADIIIDSLNDKAKFSLKLEQERKKMLNDRSALLNDLITSESVKYRKKTKTLPSFLDPQIINNRDGSKFENITTKIKSKLFKSNGIMKSQSPEKYSK